VPGADDSLFGGNWKQFGVMEPYARCFRKGSYAHASMLWNDLFRIHSARRSLVFARAQKPLNLEHVVSQELHEGKIKRETIVDAIFSVTRSTSKADNLEESREVKLIMRIGIAKL
jgi:hypothetical protein